MTSTRSDLTSRLQRRAVSADRVETERTAAHELKLLGESLRGVASSALHTIEADTAAWIGRVRGMLLRAWLLPLMVGLSLSLGISGGSWAAMRSLWTTIEQQMETSAVLDMDIKEARGDAGADRGRDVGRDAAGDRGGAVRGAADGLAQQSALGPWAGGLP